MEKEGTTAFSPPPTIMEDESVSDDVILALNVWD